MRGAEGEEILSDEELTLVLVQMGSLIAPLFSNVSAIFRRSCFPRTAVANYCTISFIVFAVLHTTLSCHEAAQAML